MRNLPTLLPLFAALIAASNGACADENDLWSAAFAVETMSVAPPARAPALDPPTAPPPAAPVLKITPIIPAVPPPVTTPPARIVTAPAPPASPPPAAAAPPLPLNDSGFYIAGNRFTLEQAFADATLGKLGVPGGFVIVVTEREAAKLTAKGAKADVKTAVRQLQRAGGTFFLCERDLKLVNVAVKDVLPGVRVERALSARELQPTSVEAAQAGTLVRRVRRACS